MEITQTKQLDLQPALIEKLEFRLGKKVSELQQYSEVHVLRLGFSSGEVDLLKRALEKSGIIWPADTS